MRKSLYIGCALQNVSENFLADIEALKIAAADEWEVLSFVGTDPAATPDTVYTTDIDMACRADLMVAVADYPSTGLGIELATRTATGAPTVVVHHADHTISRMVTGFAALQPTVTYTTYTDLIDILPTLPTYV